MFRISQVFTQESTSTSLSGQNYTSPETLEIVLGYGCLHVFHSILLSGVLTAIAHRLHEVPLLVFNFCNCDARASVGLHSHRNANLAFLSFALLLKPSPRPTVGVAKANFQHRCASCLESAIYIQHGGVKDMCSGRDIANRNPGAASRNQMLGNDARIYVLKADGCRVFCGFFFGTFMQIPCETRPLSGSPGSVAGYVDRRHLFAKLHCVGHY
ncbi:hypothetical protein BXY66_3242 [Shimia isoporae]|uniref:Uncharacterized protein n=1 Tax=Shimia isoporae TaxID=647720 RepID=A0A4R1N2Y1_9RHOB|nr:hypothetical protein BXY66_3242 [Shimia isoporae]